jgi:co-chaperonin GroES (HSP10)
MKVIAVNDKVIVEKIIEVDQMTPGGLYIPNNVEKEPQAYGKVVSVGPEVKDKSIKEGSIIIAAKFGGMAIILDNKTYVVYMDKEVYGVITEET